MSTTVLVTGGAGYIEGTLVGVLILGLIQTFITFQGTLSSWWTKIAIGVLLFIFILLQRYLEKLREFYKIITRSLFLNAAIARRKLSSKPYEN